ncbi:biotin carboxylase [Elizabethkingia argentiflava]|uniref:Biotin carboxylase n=1 Tax=Elizabethkingia argenteiflava TaxID=2681556 RepID=A0A845PYG8_9FLAO|nr:ATP-binding protein [Elizabethkingia argenteiflava]NAW51408.1 biotin carboxylase [Elizabethkingia argenteiflava]
MTDNNKQGNNNKVTIPRRISQSLLNSLKGGVVPRVGLPYITVGRRKEMEALLHDAEIVSEGGASFRMILGKYGSGKSFLLQTLRNYAMDRNFVVVDADLSPERRLYGNNGQGLATYREMIKNMSVKTRPENGALTMLLDKWIDSVQTETAESSGISPEDSVFSEKVEQKIFAVIHSMQDLVHGFDFAKLLTMYYRAFIQGNDDLKSKVLKWFRGEYTTKTEARQELEVNVIITDDDWYDYLKLFAFFFRQAGYKGMMVFVDELVNLYKIPNSIARQYNYEKILSIYNDALQGKAQYVGIIMSGTPQCVEDSRRGIYSYEALRSRLQEGKFTQQGLQDMRAPVLRLQPLTSEEMMVLTEKIADIHASLYNYERKLKDTDLLDFIKIEFGRIGAESNITPREVIRDFIELLDILSQNPESDIKTLLNSESFDYAKPEAQNKAIDPLFAKFTL